MSDVDSRHSQRASSEPGSAQIEFSLRKLINTLSSHRFTFYDEKQLHAGVAQVLDGLSMKYEHELTSGKDRFDFMLEGGIVIEVKVAGSFNEAAQQIQRYAKREDVTAVVIVATPLWARNVKRGQLCGKPIVVIPIQRKAF